MSDPLSDMLELVSARCRFSGRLIAGGSWARRFANLDAIKIIAVTEGSCWCFMEGMAEPISFRAGDVLVMNGSRALVLASAPSLITDAQMTVRVQDEEGIYRLGQGDDVAMLGGIVEVDNRHSPLLLDALPPLIHIAAGTGDASDLSWLLRRIGEEMRGAVKVGQSIMLAQLAQLTFVQALRSYLTAAPATDAGWIKGLGDPRLATALARMHADPARAWSVDDLAREAGMSRTAFAVRFREVMRMPPLTYLTSLRMLLAERELRKGASIAEVAEAIGYTSESAFSNAFKRVLGTAPGRHRKASRGNATMAAPTSNAPDHPFDV